MWQVKTCITSKPFLSTLSLRRATALAGQRIAPTVYFYPRSPCGERHAAVLRCGSRHHFYPRSPCGERRKHTKGKKRKTNISIHALLAESDSLIFPPVDTSSVISIHALLAESDQAIYPKSTPPREFLSTLSLRRATGN